MFLKETHSALPKPAGTWGKVGSQVDDLVFLGLQLEILQTVEVVPDYLLHLWVQIQELFLNLVSIDSPVQNSMEA